MQVLSVAVVPEKTTFDDPINVVVHVSLVAPTPNVVSKVVQAASE